MTESSSDAFSFSTIQQELQSIKEKEYEKEMEKEKEKEIEKKPSTSHSHSHHNKDRGLQKIADAIHSKQIKRIVILCGAGISVSCNIPDFRSPNQGIYDTIQTKYKIDSPEDIFTERFFQRNPAAFYSILDDLGLIVPISPDGTKQVDAMYQPSPTHYFFKLLQDKGLLTRIYTQNFDGLEEAAGVDPERIIPVHGLLSQGRCQKWNCDQRCNLLEKIKEARPSTFTAMERCPNHPKLVWRPSIVFFGENPKCPKGKLMDDLPNADLLIVLGTSLNVNPIRLMIHQVPMSTMRLLINREVVGTESPYGGCYGGYGFYAGDPGYGGMRPIVKDTPFLFEDFKNIENTRDVLALGDCDDQVMKLCDMLGWGKELENVMK